MSGHCQCKDDAIGKQSLHSDCSGTSEYLTQYKDKLLGDQSSHYREKSLYTHLHKCVALVLSCQVMPVLTGIPCAVACASCHAHCANGMISLA